MNELIAATIEVVEKPFAWGPYILAAIAIVTAIGGYFVRRLIVALDHATTSLNNVQVEVAVVKSVITSNLEFRIKALEERKNRDD